jgi:hypothetical protein
VEAGLTALHGEENQLAPGEDQGLTREQAEKVAGDTKRNHPVFSNISVVDENGILNYDYSVVQRIKIPAKKGNGTVNIKLKRPSGFWKSTKESLAAEQPGEHKWGTIRVKKDMARRHIISSYEVMTHFETALNGKSFDDAKKMLEDKKIVTVGTPVTNEKIREAAQEQLTWFFNETENLWVGDSAENSSIQDDRDYGGMSKSEIKSHVAKMKRKYFLKE